MHRALPPCEPPDGVHLCCLALVAVGGARPHGGWRPSAIARLQGFSSCSPAAFPHQWSSRMVTISFVVGKRRPGCGPPPALSFKDVHHPCWGGGWAELGLYLPYGPASRFFLQHSREKGILQPCGGDVLQPCGGKANWCCLVRVQLSVLHPSDGRAMRGWPLSPALRRGRTSTTQVRSAASVGATYGRTSGSLACPRPSCGGWGRGPFRSSVCTEVVAAAVLPLETEVAVALLVQRSPVSHLELVVPQAL
jgi:hypothetical protein